MHFSNMYLSVTLLASLLAPSLAAPSLISGLLDPIGYLLGLIPILSTAPPAALMTKNPSPVCANVNAGTLLCCESTFNGDIPLIVQAAPTIAYKLNPNSINCIYGTRMANASSTCSPGTALCCQIDAIVDIPVVDNLVSLALYCQNAPGFPTSSTCS